MSRPKYTIAPEAKRRIKKSILPKFTPEQRKELKELSKQLQKELFKLEHIKLGDNLWVWRCTVCGKDIAPHTVKHPCQGQVMQSKGAASRHLMTHGYDLVNHGLDIRKQTRAKLDLSEAEDNELQACGYAWISTPRTNKYRNKRYGSQLYLGPYAIIRCKDKKVLGLGSLTMDFDKIEKDGSFEVGRELFWYKLVMVK